MVSWVGDINFLDEEACATIRLSQPIISVMKKWTTLVAGLLFFATTAFAAVSVDGLRCEYLKNPQGLDVAVPRLSWQLTSNERGTMQSAYQVLVASTPELLKKDLGDLWDSGQISSDQSVQVEYGGKRLGSGTACHWKVRVWTGPKAVTKWSPMAQWTMGLLDTNDWKGQWIGNAVPADNLQQKTPLPAPLLRKTFEVSKPIRRATAYICGLGYYEMQLNGAKVGDRVLDPMITQYDKRVAYVTHDVTKQLVRGKNAIGLELGNSWYNATFGEAWNFDKAPWRAQPQMLLQLNIDYADGSTQQVVSDGAWKLLSGPIVFDQTRIGEFYDARLEKPGWSKADYDDSSWGAVAVREAPKGALAAANVEPIKVMQTLTTTKLTEPKPGVYVFDLGQNIAGWPLLRVKGPSGTTVRLKCGELLNADGTVNQKNISPHVRSKDFQLDTYTLKGGGMEVWEPKFTFHGFQYVEVEGFPGKPDASAISGRAVHTAFEQAGSFECSNELLNQIERATVWSYVGNFVGYPSDCPHREKNGWTGDAQLAVQLGLEHFRAEAAYTEWVRDIASMVRADGKLPSIVPTGGWGYSTLDGPAWESAFVLIPWELYLQSGDRRILEKNYDGFKRWVDWYTRGTTNHIIEYGLGDWCPANSKTPQSVTSTGYYYQCLRVIAKTAELMGKADEAQHYTALAEKVRVAFNEKFFNAETGQYANGTQTALSCALYQGFVEEAQRERVAQNLVANVKASNDHLDVGILGSKYLLRVLSDNGHADVAWKIATQKAAPSWGNWIERGATTLWEDWPGNDSRNHIMFGDISSWFIEYLAGIRYDAGNVGYKHVVIQPTLAGDLTWAKATRESLYGLIKSEWKRTNDRFILKVVIPPNTTATIHIPVGEGGQITEGGKSIAKVKGVKFLSTSAGTTVFKVGSGEYEFSQRYADAKR